MLLIDKLSGKPVYEQVIEGVEKNILMGIFEPGCVLPSLRELSVSLGINPNTIQKSYAELIRRGVIVSASGSGTYVAPDAVERIRQSSEKKLLCLEDMVSDLALAGIPESDVMAMVRAVYARHDPGRSNPSATIHPIEKGGKLS